MNNPATLHEPLAAKELAARLNRSVEWVRRRIKVGKIQVLPVGKPYLIHAAEVTRLTNSKNHD